MKELLHDEATGFFEDVSLNFDGVVKIGFVKNVEFGLSSAANGVGHAPDDAFDASEDESTGTHGAWFFGYVHDGIV